MDQQLLTIFIIALVVAIEAVVYYQLYKNNPNKIKTLTEEELEEAEFHESELKKYIKRKKKPYEIGLMYERYIGYLLEKDGYRVDYCGAKKGMRDQGIDLIAKKARKTLIIQAKYWAKSKVIGEKHLYQLHGTTEHYKKSHKKEKVKAVFYATTDITSTAEEVAELLHIEFRKIDYDNSYPMIKCNINNNGSHIFHLPFDKYYDTIEMNRKKGKFYAKTVVEAMSKNFRRAYKFKRRNQSA